MSEQPNLNPDNIDELEPFIPPHYMLFLAAAGLLIAVFVALTQPEFSVVGWGGLGLAGLAVLGWALMDPEQVKAAFTGRTAQYGGTAVLVTVIFLVALVAIYAFVKDLEIRQDLTQRDEYSLNEASRGAISLLGVDPTIPEIKILAFYNINQSAGRDRDTLLFDDYASSSLDKISYEFIDPDRHPLQAETYEVTRAGQVVVAPLDEAGEPDVENAELIDFLTQEELTNAIMRVSASGDFRAYFVGVENGLQLEDTGANGLSTLDSVLTDSYKWTTEQVSLPELVFEGGEFQLGDPNADGEVLVIAGGVRPLPDEQLAIITDYLNNGGDVVIFAGLGSGDAGESLATADNLSNYLFGNFGLRVNNDIVLDPVQMFQSPLLPIASDFDRIHNITSAFADGSFVVFEQTHSIAVSPTPPENVLVTELIHSSSEAYTKVFHLALTEEELAQTEDDPTGPFVLAAAAENINSGARVVIFGSQYVPSNNFESLLSINGQNLNAAFLSIVWATNFDAFFTDIPQVIPEGRPQDAPIFVSEQDLLMVNFIILILVPFGILVIGLFVWWRNRERGIAV